jgi:hypothetical protein
MCGLTCGQCCRKPGGIRTQGVQRSRMTCRFSLSRGFEGQCVSVARDCLMRVSLIMCPLCCQGLFWTHQLRQAALDFPIATIFQPRSSHDLVTFRSHSLASRGPAWAGLPGITIRIGVEFEIRGFTPSPLIGVMVCGGRFASGRAPACSGSDVMSLSPRRVSRISPSGATKELREYERLFPSTVPGKKRGDMDLACFADVVGATTAAKDRGVALVEQKQNESHHSLLKHGSTDSANIIIGCNVGLATSSMAKSRVASSLSS